jgi:MFS family permease
MPSLTYMQLLRASRPFRCLWAGQVVSELGNWFNFIAVLGLVRSITNAAPEALAILVVLRFAPFALLAPVAGALVDRWPRRTVMLAAECSSAVVALGFLLVDDAGDLWLIYVCIVALTLLSAFFEAAKNAALPSVAGDQGLLAGNALMFSSRFLLMAVGSALGGEASYRFGYRGAFVINSVSFLVSAYSIWLISERELRPAGDSVDQHATERGVLRGIARVWEDLRDGWRYIINNRLVAAIIGVNILWATGGGAINLVYERLGSVVFVGRGGPQGDRGVAVMYTAVGAGLFIGMMLARRVGAHVEMRGKTPGFIGWTVIIHGVLFSLAGVMPDLWLAALMLFVSRAVIGVEFAVQETLIMRMLPDRLRGRIFTTDRAAEVAVMSIFGLFWGWTLTGWLTPRSLAVISGILSASPGIVWLMLFAAGALKMPRLATEQKGKSDDNKAALASAG